MIRVFADVVKMQEASCLRHRLQLQEIYQVTVKSSQQVKEKIQSKHVGTSNSIVNIHNNFVLELFTQSSITFLRNTS